MLLGILRVSLSVNFLIGKGAIANMPGPGTIRASEGTIRAGGNF